MSRAITRRQLLRSAGVGAVGLSLSGVLGEIVSGALAPASPGPPRPPKWRTRPDLRIPSLTVTRSEQGVSSDPIFIAPYNIPVGQVGAVIVDNGGEPIWENPLAGKVTTNFRVQRYRGEPVLTWWEGVIEYGHGVGEYVIADSSYRTVRRVQAARGLHGDLHEFVITPRGTALLTSYVITGADLTSVGGPRKGTIQDAIFQEIDLASGEVLLEWHSLDRIPLKESYALVEAKNWDFFHINSVDLDGDGNLLVSARSTHTIYKIDRSGAIVWRLGGKHSDFSMAVGSNFAWQHDARRQPDGTLTLFDNGATPAVEKLSRGLILDVDEQAMSATLLRQYTHPKILTGSQGSMQLLANGNVFIGWGEVPRVSEFDRAGRLLFDAVLGDKYQSYRAFRLPWSGLPAQAPAIAVSREGRGEMSAYASWNGATGVRTWQLLAGQRADALRPVSNTSSRGFESALHTTSEGPLFAVQALDSEGGALGQSRTVSVL
ncbi:MAG TPA: arylsulfotransferase family protein [Solirubrobacteraceae bacterium]